MLTVGGILKKEREKRGLSLEDIFEATRVRVRYLRYIEENKWDRFISRVYITGIIKKYASLLNLDEEKLLAFFRRDYEKREKVRFKKKVPKEYFTPLAKKILSWITFAVILIFFVYFAHQVVSYILPPSISIKSPKEWTVKNRKYIEIVGKVKKDSQVKINGEIVSVNEDGSFRYKLPLIKGKNNIKIQALGANGKSNLLQKTILNK